MHQLVSWFLVFSIMVLFAGLSKKLYTNFIVKGATESVYQSKSQNQKSGHTRQRIISGTQTSVNVNPLHNTVKRNNTSVVQNKTGRTYQQKVRSYREYKEKHRISR